MFLRPWDRLPADFQIPEIRPYYDAVAAKPVALLFKRLFDLLASSVAIVFLAPILLLLSVAIKLDSKGPVFFRQARVTQYGRTFRIFKFRSMVADAESCGSAVTVSRDPRVTRVGAFLRKTKLDEIPQLFNVFSGDMSFVGTRPEVPRYVSAYLPEWRATLLLPAGITSLASIFYKDENTLIDAAVDPDRVYLDRILPDKMKWNLRGLLRFGFWNDIALVFMTILAICGKNFKEIP